jgi:hypothetical protein
LKERKSFDSIILVHPGISDDTSFRNQVRGKRELAQREPEKAAPDRIEIKNECTTNSASIRVADEIQKKIRSDQILCISAQPFQMTIPPSSHKDLEFLQQASEENEPIFCKIESKW